MTFLIDANVIVYAAVPSRYRDACVAILEAVADGKAEGRVSAAILEEVWHIELSGRAGKIDGLARRSYLLFTPLLPVSDEIVARALELDLPRLGANDRIHVATSLANGIDTIVSADADFDRVPALRRVDPLSRDETSQLIHP